MYDELYRLPIVCLVPKLIKSAFTVLNLPYYYAGKHEEIIQSKPIHVHTKTFCAMYHFFTSIFRTFSNEDQTDFNWLMVRMFRIIGASPVSWIRLFRNRAERFRQKYGFATKNPGNQADCCVSGSHPKIIIRARVSKT